MSISEIGPKSNYYIPEDNVLNQRFDIHPDVVDDVVECVRNGYRVELDDTQDMYALGSDDQARVDNEIQELEYKTLRAIEETGFNPLLLKEGRSAFDNWQPLTKRAIALHNIYNPNIGYLGEGIDGKIYDRPLFSANDLDNKTFWFSAAEVLELQMGTEKASKIVNQYREFIGTPIDDASRDIWLGARDGAGVRTRATCAMEKCVMEAVNSMDTAEGITTASLACGAAGPVYQLMRALDDKGIEVNKAILADIDPMALASAYSLAELEGVEGKIELSLENLVDMNTLQARDLTEFIDAKSVDVVDLLGLFEYFPRPLAVNLLEQVKKVIKPGGVIVFGNMIDRRPQQTFFSDVSLWPELQQRSVKELFDIIDESGFDSKNNSRILLPPQGVYAVVEIRSPQDN